MWCVPVALVQHHHHPNDIQALTDLQQRHDEQTRELHDAREHLARQVQVLQLELSEFAALSSQHQTLSQQHADLSASHAALEEAHQDTLTALQALRDQREQQPLPPLDDARASELDARSNMLDVYARELDSRADGLESRAQALEARLHEIDTCGQQLTARLEDVHARERAVSDREPSFSVAPDETFHEVRHSCVSLFYEQVSIETQPHS